MDQDQVLLERYAKNKSQEAFEALVRRHVDWIYSSAVRQAGDSHSADDVTQAVFILLARKAHRITGRSLTGWLFRAVRLAAKEARRRETRRRIHEQRASSMRLEQQTAERDGDWEQIRPLLDRAVARLGGKDRDAVLLRFYRGLSHAEIGTAIGLSEEAAKKRVQRALERLRDDLAAYGVAVNGAAMALSVQKHVTAAAPMGLAERIVSADGTQAAAANLIAKGVEKMLTWMKVGVATGVMAATAAGTLVLAEVSSGPQTSAVVQASADVVAEIVKTNQRVQYVHLRMEPPTAMTESWVELDEVGKMQRARWVFPKTEDGPKDVVFENGKAHVWFKAKSALTTVSESMTTAQRALEQFMPATAADRISRASGQGVLKSETDRSPDGTTVIRLSVTDPSDLRTVYYVDADTRLLRKIEFFARGAKPKQVVHLDYSKDAQQDVFVLNPPANVVRINETTDVIGLPRKDLSDSQIAQKVAREFFQALIAEDYALAGQLFSGLPEAKTREIFGRMRVLEIVSVGEATPHKIPGVGGMVVPCKVRLERDGKEKIHDFQSAVRPVYSQPDYWAIHGGI